jgi:hypothetical protein
LSPPAFRHARRAEALAKTPVDSVPERSRPFHAPSPALIDKRARESAAGLRLEGLPVASPPDPAARRTFLDSKGKLAND